LSDAPISDGNGGTLDPQTASTRDLLVALHTKMDLVVLPALADHGGRLKSLEQAADNAAGGRKAYYALMTVVLAVVLASAGLVTSRQLTPSDVSRQIQKEAPCPVSGCAGNDRVARIETRLAVLQQQKVALEKLIHFICRTRVPLLPNC
jgi:hypothetical protein